jgi:predicted HTH domain antitoxin
MQTVNIRQLKTNPSTALAAARDDDMVIVMNRDRPQALLVDLEQLKLHDLPAVRVALAVSLFRSGAISAGFAARMADKPLADMLTLLSSQGIPLSGVSKAAADETREEMRAARDWLAPTA